MLAKTLTIEAQQQLKYRTPHEPRKTKFRDSPLLISPSVLIAPATPLAALLTPSGSSFLFPDTVLLVPLFPLLLLLFPGNSTLGSRSARTEASCCFLGFFRGLGCGGKATVQQMIFQTRKASRQKGNGNYTVSIIANH